MRDTGDMGEFLYTVKLPEFLKTNNATIRTRIRSIPRTRDFFNALSKFLPRDLSSSLKTTKTSCGAIVVQRFTDGFTNWRCGSDAAGLPLSVIYQT